MGGYALHLAVGIMGNATSLLLFAAPILTFKRVIRKRSTEEYSCVPYIVALFNCFLYTWYGLPVVSNKWENFPLVTINGLGVLMESTFIFIYFWFASAKGKKVVALVAVPVITAICITALVSTFAFHSHRQRKVFVGSVGLVACVGMYGSPLVAACPNLIGCPLGIFQLMLYFMYRKKGIKAEPIKMDIESNGSVELKTPQPAINGTNGKI
ncbi:bidirectional sugar transporter SWEET3b-like isoform X2 [Macadamia integrifolia]|uniref:bidirectional sugar transporter SWEET3b-like isoform X2 n=1 Tax=Macadamia integrifolia TaxID=60698 RepID=UPI001C5339DA|nr:bidirectional sugar transporter SWEET3b-like isoform X2 [Macadamia integrifolia]